jgi:hypothetical protein
MAKLWNKFLVTRRDGSIPKWPWLVLGARDPAAPYTIRALAEKSQSLGMDVEYVEDLYRLANEWDEYRQENGEGDPDSGPHREDNHGVISAINSVNATVNHRAITEHKTDGTPCECHPATETFG